MSMPINNQHLNALLQGSVLPLLGGRCSGTFRCASSSAHLSHLIRSLAELWRTWLNTELVFQPLDFRCVGPIMYPKVSGHWPWRARAADLLYYIFAYGFANHTSQIMSKPTGQSFPEVLFMISIIIIIILLSRLLSFFIIATVWGFMAFFLFSFFL